MNILTFFPIVCSAFMLEVEEEVYFNQRNGVIVAKQENSQEEINEMDLILPPEFGGNEIYIRKE